jgi:hypothetical protein
MKTPLLLAAWALGGSAGAQVFTSGLEAWTGSTPDGWMGSKSSIAASAVAQVGTNPHGGSYAVSLENATPDHKRFTTTSLEVDSGASYEISYWVRGNGEIRSGLYDGRSSGSGYATYSSYAVIASPDTWTQVTQVVTAGNDTTGAEFILSVRNTAPPAQLVVDDVNINLATVPATSIHDIQNTTDPDGDSPMVGQVVQTGGIVTADLPDAGDGYFVQSGNGPWSGIYVYDLDHAPAIGDSVTFTANVSEFSGTTELTGVTNFTVVSSGNTVVPFDVATGDVALEPMESVLLRVVNASCTVAPSGATFGKYNVDDGTGECIIGKLIYTTDPAPTVGAVYTITGVNFYDFGEFNIQPRMTSDVEWITGIAAVSAFATATMGPNPASEQFTIRWAEAADHKVEYTLTDAQGRLVRSGRFGSGLLQIPLADMPAGLYHLVLRTAGARMVFPVQVVH